MRRALSGGILWIGLAGWLGYAQPLAAEPVAVDSLKEASPAGNQQIEEVSDALKRFRTGDLEGAKTLLDTAFKKHPELPPPRLILVQWLAQSNQGAAVRNQLEQAVTEMPDDPEAYVIIGDLAVQGRRLTEAELVFKKAREVLANFKGDGRRKSVIERRVLQGLATVAQNRQDWTTAQKDWEQLLAMDSKNAVALQQLAWVLFQQQKPTDALEKLKAAQAADKNVLTPEAILAQFYQRNGDKKSAAKWMVAALTAAPKDLRTRIFATQWSLDTDQLQQAQQQADSALQLDPTSVDAHFLRGVVALYLKDYPKATECFQKVVSESPSSFPGSNNLALSLAEQDDTAKKKALEYAEMNARQFPNQAEAFSTLGWVYYKLGRLDEAETALRKAISSGQLSADTAYYIARISVDRDRKDEARQLLEQALRSTAPFSMRSEAKSLLEQLTKSSSGDKKDESGAKK
jgi:tetratricopeptide (TPR) repeat protein